MSASPNAITGWIAKTNQPLTYKNGDEAQFDSLDEAITAFLDHQLTAEQNEEMAQ